ncbi:riboflavin synthase subunit alpha [Buchnera aphidicola (Neophyllaphis varicolor)]|uniref:riboflavin synthase subunit alpha n=1 Tax=Buchnera aphidicola TaxID=9 RepID=UPI0031B8B0FD
MFTGIVQGIAKVVSIIHKNNFSEYKILFSNHLLQNINLGSSVSLNGCCLTVTNINHNYVSFNVIKETLSLTNLINLIPNDLLNIERSVKLGDEIGGHIVTGHIMNKIAIIDIERSNNVSKIVLELTNPLLKKYVFYKGFICLDGISLTVSDLSNNSFSVNLIPETIKRTTLYNKNIGDFVNIEIDYFSQLIVDTTFRLNKK